MAEHQCDLVREPLRSEKALRFIRDIGERMERYNIQSELARVFNDAGRLREEASFDLAEMGCRVLEKLADLQYPIFEGLEGRIREYKGELENIFCIDAKAIADFGCIVMAYLLVLINSYFFQHPGLMYRVYTSGNKFKSARYDIEMLREAVNDHCRGLIPESEIDEDLIGFWKDDWRYKMGVGGLPWEVLNEGWVEKKKAGKGEM
ncbi:hypothetical protein QBC38DRAFT_460583 [Podospora fimiseda]|uniref:Uncharacterized protein n=1 Tax=Podospora fimiseda TaxID=252190 RepID=A0AAN7BGN8_9PEZI|nr:hypothetical protein QBC38DRAFT_460583 [Podospora fimiseda]